MGRSCIQNKRRYELFQNFNRYTYRKENLRRRRLSSEVNIRMDLKETGNNMRKWVDSTQNRNYWRTFVNAALTSG